MDAVSLKKLNQDHVEDLRELFGHCQDYFNLVDGVAACGRKADNELAMVVQGREQTCCGIYQNSAMIGCIFYIEKYIQPEELTITLMLMRPEDRSSGLGTRLVMDLIEQMQAQGYKKILVGVDDVNERAMSFWQSLGFVATGHRQELMRKNRPSHVIHLEKLLK